MNNRIKTWQERMHAPNTEMRCTMNCYPRQGVCNDCEPVKVHGDSVAARDAEIAELRAALEMINVGPTAGVDLIAAERARQIAVEGWTPEHDDEHDDASLALAAICYAAPERVYVQRDYAAGIGFFDPWPQNWDDHWDKRFRCNESKENPSNVPPDPAKYTHEERIDYLIKAGALIAAEIDRLQRAVASTPAQEDM